jgi:hypothetical protein
VISSSSLTKRATLYPRDWRLKNLHLTQQEESEFKAGTRQVIALTCAIFFSVCLLIALIFTILQPPK